MRGGHQPSTSSVSVASPARARSRSTSSGTGSDQLDRARADERHAVLAQDPPGPRLVAVVRPRHLVRAVVDVEPLAGPARRSCAGRRRRRTSPRGGGASGRRGAAGRGGGARSAASCSASGPLADHDEEVAVAVQVTRPEGERALQVGAHERLTERRLGTGDEVVEHAVELGAWMGCRARSCAPEHRCSYPRVRVGVRARREVCARADASVAMRQYLGCHGTARRRVEPSPSPASSTADGPCPGRTAQKPRSRPAGHRSPALACRGSLRAG